VYPPMPFHDEAQEVPHMTHPGALPPMPDPTFVERVRQVGLDLLIIAVRTRLRTGIPLAVVGDWIEGELIAASARVDAIERAREPRD
jgi:hypothetical protein